MTIVSNAASVTAHAQGPAAIALAPTTWDGDVGSTFPLTATVTDKQGRVLTGVPLTWASDAPAVASVDANGVVSLVADGTANITASTP